MLNRITKTRFPFPRTGAPFCPARARRRPGCLASFGVSPSLLPRGHAALSLSLYVLLLLALSLHLSATSARAVVATDGGPIATRLTSIGGLTAAELSALELQGRFRSFLGTPIDETHFLTAQHIGITLSDTITFSSGPNTGTYSIVQWHDDPGSDLRIVEIAGTFTEWALLFGSTDEAGRSATIFGRGGAPVAQVFVQTELKGWTVAPPDGAISWGRNLITGTLSGNLIYAQFEINGLDEEAGLSNGDSGGAWFIEDSLGLLRLAGISFATTGPFQQDANGAPDGNIFNAGIFDIGGLWIGDAGAEVFIPENPVNVPGVGIATRVSDRIDWISGIISIPGEDTDDDGILNTFDNCPFAANPSQLDNGGLGFGTVGDGIGNACQCGDVTGEGQVNDTDAAFIKRHALGLAAPLFLVPDNCDVTGDGFCNGTDASFIRQAAVGFSNPNFGQNCPNALP